MDVLLLILILLIVLWVLGLATAIGGSLIHLLLAVALIVLIIRLARGQGI